MLKIVEVASVDKFGRFLRVYMKCTQIHIYVPLHIKSFFGIKLNEYQ